MIGSVSSDFSSLAPAAAPVDVGGGPTPDTAHAVSTPA